MEIIEYFKNGEGRELFLEQIGNSDWVAGKYLYKLLKNDKLEELTGESPKVFLLSDGGKLAAFCTLTAADDIPDSELTPWIGFAYTFPEYRGRRHMGQLIDRAAGAAASEGHEAVYISTDHEGLYEKYGFEFYKNMTDRRGEISRVYIRRLK
ncbi:MAG: GNAT family N-acetyltransferase [Ruminococcus sp.]|nr:GNAT family N-acetyltransferase [Ruminococcus sp.]